MGQGERKAGNTWERRGDTHQVGQGWASQGGQRGGRLRRGGLLKWPERAISNEMTVPEGGEPVGTGHPGISEGIPH